MKARIITLSYVLVIVISIGVTLSLPESKTFLDIYNANSEMRKTDQLNKSPYAIFGDNSQTLMTEQERTLNYCLEIENPDNEESASKFELNMQTGKVKLFDKKGNLISELLLQPDQLTRFMTIDRYAEKYYDMTPYQYAANNPINNIDVNGDSIWFTQTDNAYTMHVSGKLINMSDNNVNMGKALKGIIYQLQSTFSGEVDGMTFNTEVDLSVAETMEDVSESDHLFVLSEITNDKIGGAANDFGGKVAFVDADYFTGPVDATIGNVGEKLATHEFGHLLNLKHVDGNTNIMRTKEQNRWYSFATKTTSRQLSQIVGSYNTGVLNQGSPFGIMGLPNTGKVSSIIRLKQIEQKRRRILNLPGY